MPRLGESSPDLTFSAAALDRQAERREDPDLIPTLLADPATRVVEIRGDRAAVVQGLEGGPSLVTRAPAPTDAARLVVFLGSPTGGDPAAEPDGPAYVAVVLPGEAEPGEQWRTLRQVAATLDPTEAAIWVTAQGVANWHATHRFCPMCGNGTEVDRAGWVRRCPVDDSLHFPRTDPAVIMAVTDADDRLLLARGRGFNSIGMSVLAGFVEPGETLAAAVAREVKEEVGLDVTEATYLGDQPWPFPSSLMIGFRARALSGRIRMQESEIEATRWVSRDELVAAIAAGELAISPRLSIARWLIEDWFGGPVDSPELTLRRR